MSVEGTIDVEDVVIIYSPRFGPKAGRHPLFQVVAIVDGWAWLQAWPYSPNYTKPTTEPLSELTLVHKHVKEPA